MSRVLIVDDNEDNLFLFQEYLEDNGFEVDLARSGTEALESLAHTLVDAIVLDIQMPEMDGFEVCRRLKEEDRTKEIPVIFVTAKFQDVDSVATGLYLGASDYLYKPVEEKDLVDRVTSVIGPVADATAVDVATGLPAWDVERVALDEHINRTLSAGRGLSLAQVAIGGFDASDAPSDADAAMIRIARVLSSKARPKDLLGHWGPRQFLVLMPGSRLPIAQKTAE
ncbi:MAG: response regulator, partial [Myxococcota bacterium]